MNLFKTHIVWTTYDISAISYCQYYVTELRYASGVQKLRISHTNAWWKNSKVALENFPHFSDSKKYINIRQNVIFARLRSVKSSKNSLTVIFQK